MGTRYKCFGEAILTSTHKLFFEQKYEKYQKFLSENFNFLVAKFSVYLNRHIFVIFSQTKEFDYSRKVLIFMRIYLFHTQGHSQNGIISTHIDNNMPLTASEIRATLKGKNLVSEEANSFL